MKTFNNQFGELEYDAKHVILFPEGMIGFQHCTKYILIDDIDTEPFRWLVSLDDSELCFPLLDPLLVMEGYEQQVLKTDASVAFVVASLHELPERSTVNLKSPVVIEKNTQRGKQIILEDERLPMRYQFLKSPQTGAGAGQSC
ncbi:MAG TPA: flagellar assembly protein FliW [Bacteroidota bacterium]|nr:flagellar assembly protein FliW [Bacteroidota bacterium]